MIGLSLVIWLSSRFFAYHVFEKGRQIGTICFVLPYNQAGKALKTRTRKIRPWPISPCFSVNAPIKRRGSREGFQTHTDVPIRLFYYPATENAHTFAIAALIQPSATFIRFIMNVRASFVTSEVKKPHIHKKSGSV